MKKMPVSHHLMWVTCLVCLFTLTSFAASTSGEQSQLTQRPKIGLVLSGGGARGFAHIGVLKILEENKIPVDFIAGTSMGSIIGGLYAMGMTIEEIESTVLTIDWKNVFDDLIPRQERSFRRKRDDDIAVAKAKLGYGDGKFKLPQGIVQGVQIANLLQKLTLPVATIKDFDKLSIPFRAVATDIATGEQVVLGTGNLAQAIRASMSVPAAMMPVEIEGKLLVDGGISSNLPVTVVREMGADVLIVVDISTPLLEREELESALKITLQLTGLLTQRGTQAQKREIRSGDILLVPELGDITSGDFDRGKEIIDIGLHSARENITALRGLAITDGAYTRHVAERPKPDKELPVIDFIRLNNQSRLGDDVLRARLTIQPGQQFDEEIISEDIRRIYGLELFQTVIWELVEENGQTGLVLHVIERPWGPNYLQFGLSVEGDLEGDNSFNFTAAYLRTAVNELGGEWRARVSLGDEPGVSVELYQPLDVGSRYFYHLSALAQQENVKQFQDEDATAEFRLRRSGVILAVGRELGNWGELRIGWRRFVGETKLRVGDPALSTDDFDTGQAFVKLSVDTLDDLYFPHSGNFGSLEWRSSREDLGDDSDYDQGELHFFSAKSWGRESLMGSIRYSTTADDNAPLEGLFRAGGFLRLSGLQTDQLSGQHYGQLLASYRHQISEFNAMPTYLGTSLEVGNVWQDEDDISFDNTITAGSIYVGLDTKFGALYLAYGRAEGDRDSIYISLGNFLWR